MEKVIYDVREGRVTAECTFDGIIYMYSVLLSDHESEDEAMMQALKLAKNAACDNDD